jgi:hypothetical protein
MWEADFLRKYIATLHAACIFMSIISEIRLVVQVILCEIIIYFLIMEIWFGEDYNI